MAKETKASSKQEKREGSSELAQMIEEAFAAEAARRRVGVDDLALPFEGIKACLAELPRVNQGSPDAYAAIRNAVKRFVEPISGRVFKNEDRQLLNGISLYILLNDPDRESGGFGIVSEPVIRKMVEVGISYGDLVTHAVSGDLREWVAGLGWKARAATLRNVEVSVGMVNQEFKIYDEAGQRPYAVKRPVVEDEIFMELGLDVGNDPDVSGGAKE